MDSRRMRRINELLKHTIGEILCEGRLRTQFNGLITVTEVRVSSDLSYCRVNFTVLGAEEEAALGYLNYSRYEMTGMIAQKVNLRVMPKLQFFVDEDLKRANRIEELIREIKHD